MTQPPIDPAELARPSRHLFLSPHYDDTALSCGGTAALLARHGRSPEIALIFGAEPDPTLPLTPFAEQLHRRWGLPAREVIAGRQAEEAAAARLLGAEDRYLPFRDAIYRGERYLNDDQLVGEVAPDETHLAGELIAALALDEAERRAIRLYAPLAIGSHVDHQHAFAAGLALARAGWPVWFYEDLPYALDAAAAPARFRRLPVPFAVAALVDVSPVWTVKLDAIFAYPSQLPTVFRHVGSDSSRPAVDAVMAGYAREAGSGVLVERFWAPAQPGKRAARKLLGRGY